MSAVLRVLRGVVGLGALAWLLLGPDQRSVRQESGPAAQTAEPQPPDSPEQRSPDAGAGVRISQVVLGVVGLGVLVWGGWLLVSLGSAQWLSVGLWLAGGVVGHDAVLAPLVVVLGVLAVRLVPAAARAPLAVALIVWGSITLVAVPVLGRFGALPDNPTLLDRPYQTSWWLLSAVVAATVLVASVVRARTSRT